MIKYNNCYLSYIFLMNINNVIVFLREVNSEIYKISWPTLRNTVVSSLLVLIAVIIASLFFLIVDGIIANLSILY